MDALKQDLIGYRPIVYIDESGFSHDMPRIRGYSKKGHRCYGTHDWGAKGRTNAIGALIGATLLTVSLQDLIPKRPEQSVVVMDNASFHKQPEMQNTLAAAGHTLLYLPPYSPDLNPIEHKWAQIKALRRKVGGSIDALFSNLIV